MNNIQTYKLLERQELLYFHRQTQNNQNHSYSFQPSYSKLSRLSPNQTEQNSLSRIKSGGLSLTKSKGLTLSSRKQLPSKKQLTDQNNIFNPQNLQQSGLIRRKTASTLVKTAHTIHYLGGSLSKSKQDNKKSKYISKQKIIHNQDFTQSYHVLSHSLRNQQSLVQQRNNLISLNNEKSYIVKITPPKQTININESKEYSQQLKQSKLGKIHQLKKKDFLRSSKKENISQKNDNNQSKYNNHNNILGPPPSLKTSHKNLQIKSRRQFLQSYIQKPLINSIILSKKIDNLGEEPQSPVLRLKKRLQMNSINCIFQKQTLISHQVHENKSSRIQVQQSLIVHRNVGQNIRPLMHKINLFAEGDQLPYKLYLGQQLHSNLILTVKQLPLEYFEKFARQLRIYQQIESNRLQTKNILQLIKHSTDSDKHLIIKQPYTQTLNEYLQTYVVKKISRLQFEYLVESIVRIVRRIIETLQGIGVILKRRITLNDFVFVFINLKFENLEMFEIGYKAKMDKQKILQEFRLMIQNYFNNISSGSLNL